jgi:hypothetical protein
VQQGHLDTKSALAISKDILAEKGLSSHAKKSSTTVDSVL